MKRRLLTVLCLISILASMLTFSVSAEASGECGDNTTWLLNDSGVLMISGSGAIRDYIYEGADLWPNNKAPWRKYASKIKKVIVGAGITRIGDNAFCCLTNVTSVSIANTVTSIGQAAFCDMKALTQISIPDSVTEMEKSVFSGCKSLTTVKLPKNLKILPEGTFKECHALKSIDLPKGITEISYSTFKFTGLTSIVIPEGVVIIRDSAFQYCDKLKTVKLPSNLEQIGMQAFSDSGITSITLPASLQSIGRSFVWCHSLKSVRFEGNAPQMDSYAFDDVTATVYYPKDNATWTQSVRKNYEGNLTWVAYCSNGHTWGQWTIEKEATCAATGLKVRRCTQCDTYEEQSLPKAEHAYTDVVIEPTCLREGYTSHTCEGCGHSYADSKTPTGDHSFGAWEVIQEATCLEKGSRQRSCTICQTRTTEETDFADHDYLDEITPATCIQKGFTTHICKICGDHKIDTYTELTAHIYGPWTENAAPSWLKEGEQHRNCVVCAVEEREVLSKVPVPWGLILSCVAICIATSVVIIVVGRTKRQRT